MSQRDDLIRLFIEENTFACTVMAQGRECPACTDRAETLADNVLKVLGLAADPEPVVTLREVKGPVGGGVYDVYVNSNIVGTVRRHGGKWAYREPFHPSVGLYDTRQQAVDALVAAAVEGNT